VHKDHEEKIESPSKEVREAEKFSKKVRRKAKKYNRLDKDRRSCGKRR
jgi:hypothetical protein